MKYCSAVILVLVAACGTTQRIQDDYLRYTGSTQVMAAGTRSETVVFEDFESGDRFALVGELAAELVPQYGLPIVITAVPTEYGWSVDPNLQKLELIDYVILDEEEILFE